MARKKQPKPRASLLDRLAALLRRHWALGVVTLVLLATYDERYLVDVTDAKQMNRTAIAIAETGEVGIADSPDGAVRAIRRSEGDAVSRYGMGMSLAQVPAALVAPFFERTFGPGRSQILFAIAPLLFVLLASASAGWAARLLGAGPRGHAVAVLLAGLGSPLGSYASMALSDGMQAATLGLAFAASLAAAREEDGRRAALFALSAGVAAGVALLTKSSLLAPTPLVLLPLLASRTGARRTVLWAAGGALPLAALWLAFEVVRFGRPFTSYGGEGFTHPLLDGLWRLLVGPNKGLLFFFPAFVVALVAVAHRLAAPRGEDRVPFLAAAGSLGAFLTLLVMNATWWSWHGVVGWGPRLLVPGIPLLAPWAGLLMETWRPLAVRAAVGVSILLNVPSLLVHPSVVEKYMTNMKPVPLAELMRIPKGIKLNRRPDGTPVVSPADVLPTIPSAAAHFVTPWFLGLQLLGDDAEVARRLDSPPWIGAHPELGPRISPLPPEMARLFVPPLRWSFFGRSFFESGKSLSHPIYLLGLGDQIRRAHQTGKLERGLALAEKISELTRNPDNEPLLAESYRLLGRRETALAYLMRARSIRGGPHPCMPVIFALLARDQGDEEQARTTLADAAQAFPRCPIEKAVNAPLAEWPRDVYGMIDAPRDEEPVQPGLPSFGDR